MHSFTHLAITGLLVIALIIAPTQARSAQPRPPAAPVVIELFTSQGCSSCPPADALLGELAMRPNVIALAFHVEYWDSLGWRDAFSVSQAAPRQSRYVETLGLSSGFTPQVVIDGRGSYIGSDRRHILAALAENAESIPLTVFVADNNVVVTLPAGSKTDDYAVNVVALLSQASTHIGQGENGGRTLREFNIVRQFRRLGEWHGQQKVLKVALDSLPRDATHVAVLLQRSGQGPIDGSAIIALN